MNCWYCQTDLETTQEFYGDKRCPKCGILNSIFNLADIQPKEEEEMGINYNDEKYQSKYVYLPKVGETGEFDIVDIHEVQSDKPQFNFSENIPVTQNGEPVIDDDGEPVFKKKDLGYHVVAKLNNGKILTITSLGTFLSVFKKYNIQDGDKVRIAHPEKGTWLVEKI